MRDIKIKELIDLASIEIENPELEIQKVYNWHHDRKIMTIKGTISIAISLIISLAIAYFKSEIEIDGVDIFFPLIFAILIMTYGLYELVKVRKLGKKYIAAIYLLHKFKRIKPFLIKYRQAINNQ